MKVALFTKKDKCFYPLTTFVTFYSDNALRRTKSFYFWNAKIFKSQQ